MAKDSYAKHEWRQQHRHGLVWYSSVNATTDSIKKAIEYGSKFTVAMLDGEDIWNIHPVQLPFLY